MGDAGRPPADDSRRQPEVAPEPNCADNSDASRAATEPDAAGNSDADRADEGREPSGGPQSGAGRKGPGRRLKTRHIAWLALAVAVGHIIYAFIRDHALDLTRGSW